MSGLHTSDNGSLHTLAEVDGVGHPEALRSALRVWCEGFNFERQVLKKFLRDDHESPEFLRAYGHVKPFTAKDIDNDCKKARPAEKPGRTYQGRGDTAAAEVEQLSKWANDNDVFCRTFSALVVDDKGERPVHGVAVVPKEYVHALVENAFLVLLDATHHTNQWNWYLFTILVRDKYGSWIPAAHFYTESQHAAIVEGGFRAVRSFASFQPRYVVLDDSAAEQKAVRDFDEGITTLLCQKHWKDAVFKQLSGEACAQSRRWVQKALYFAINNKECGQMCDRAIECVPKGEPASILVLSEENN